MPLDVGQEGMAGLLHDQAYPDGGREVEDGVTAVHELAHDGRRQHRLDSEMA